MKSKEVPTNFERGAHLVSPYLHLHGQVAKKIDSKDFCEGVRLLESVSNDEYWEANWLLGKAYEAKLDLDSSVAYFAKAYAIAPEKSAVVHEYVVALLKVKQTATAESVIDCVRLNDDPALALDAALVKCRAGKLFEAIQLLDSYSWPVEHVERANELRQRVRRAIKL